MEFRDKKQIDGKYELDKHGHRTHAFEVILQTREEVELMYLSVRGLAHNLLSNKSEGIRPIDSVILLDYIQNFAANPSRVSLTSNQAERFAALLRTSSVAVLGQVQGEQVKQMANEIEEEALKRSLHLKLNSVPIEKLFE